MVQKVEFSHHRQKHIDFPTARVIRCLCIGAIYGLPFLFFIRNLPRFNRIISERDNP